MAENEDRGGQEEHEHQWSIQEQKEEEQDLRRRRRRSRAARARDSAKEKVVKRGRSEKAAQQERRTRWRRKGPRRSEKQRPRSIHVRLTSTTLVVPSPLMSAEQEDCAVAAPRQMLRATSTAAFETPIAGVGRGSVRVRLSW